MFALSVLGAPHPPHTSQAVDGMELEAAVEAPGVAKEKERQRLLLRQRKKKGAGKGTKGAVTKSRKRQVDELLKEDDKENAADPNADEGQGLLLYKEIDRAYSL
jgi:hypothetical protein